jgi:uncharacterized cupin superfamily protein
MAIQYSVTVRDARNDAIDTGTVLSTINLPADYMANSSNGTKSKAGTWQDASADASGTPGHFRIYATDGTTCHIQGDVTLTAGGGVMTVDSMTFTAGQQFTVTGFAVTASGA